MCVCPIYPRLHATGSWKLRTARRSRQQKHQDNLALSGQKTGKHIPGGQKTFWQYPCAPTQYHRFPPPPPTPSWCQLSLRGECRYPPLSPTLDSHWRPGDALLSSCFSVIEHKQETLGFLSHGSWCPSPSQLRDWKENFKWEGAEERDF